MTKPTGDYLSDILKHITYIETFTRDGEAKFRDDPKTQLAVMRAYEVIGEIVKRLPQEMLDQQPEIEWKAIKGFRDILIHQYDNVDLNIVWASVVKLPLLRAAVEALLAAVPPEED